MGCFEIYCCFCAGPLCDARQAWLYEVQTWRDNLNLSFPPPPAPTKDVVTITEEDGKFWEDFVCVGQHWGESFVSPSGLIKDSVGGISINGSSDWQDTAGHYLVIHRHCLSFLSRRINATPKEIWESFFSPGSDYLKFGANHPTLLYCLKYYDMEGRDGQWFGYAIERQTPRKDGEEGIDRWYDPSSMEDLQWILARPCVFPLIQRLSIPVVSASTNSVSSMPQYLKVLKIPELFDLILDFIVSPGTSQTELAQEMKAATVYTPPSVALATYTVFSLLQVSKDFYAAMVHDRQDVFLRLAWEHGWMLPATPHEWKNWQNGTFDMGKSSTVEKDKDWKAYLLSFLRKEDVHIKNRWRFHRTALQFARGRIQINQEGEVKWRWSVGELGVRTDATSPKPYTWEGN